jgi:hypothetical protein
VRFVAFEINTNKMIIMEKLYKLKSNTRLKNSNTYYVMRSKNEVLCAAAGRLAAERSAPNNIHYFFFKPS